MGRNEFLEKLESLLSILPYNERRDILYDFEEHFNSRIEEGQLEEDIAISLGDPYTIARKYLPDLPAVIEEEVPPEPEDEVVKKNTPKSKRKSSKKYYKYETHHSNQHRSTYNYYNEVPKNYHEQKPIKKGNSPGTVVILTLTAILLNLMFVVPIYVPVFATVFAIAVTFFALVIVGIVISLAVIFGFPFAGMNLPFVFVQEPLLGICASVALISISGILLIATIYILKFLIYIAGNYVHWLVKVIRGY